MNGALPSQNDRFSEEKYEFFWFVPFFISLVICTFLMHRSYDRDRRIWATAEDVTLNVIDKIPGKYRSRGRIGLLHGPFPVYVYATSKWYRTAQIGRPTTVKFSAKYHGYLDPYHKFSADKFLIGFLALMNLVILWRGIWLGLYIWYWKQ